MPDVWECYGHGAPGKAIVSAPTRALAVQTCREWLGWRVIVAFKKSDVYVLWVNCGGAAEKPVVYAADGVHFAALEQPLTAQVPEESTGTGYWEDRL